MTRRINIHEHVEATIPVQELTRLQESAKTDNSLPTKITTVVEAIHSGLTRNYTFYPADNLERSVESWTSPYEKPVIKNHDVSEEPLGRVKSARYQQSNIAPDKQTIELELEITDEDTIKKVLDGRYKTLSIGGSTNSVTCSVCAKDLVKEGYCGHMKGRTYEGKQAHWIIGEMSFDEISWVNVPADSNAQVVHKNTAAKQAELTSTTEGGVNEMDEQAENILEQIDNLVGITEENDNEPEATEPETQVVEGSENTPSQPEDGVQKESQEEPKSNEGPTLEEQLKEANDRIATLEAENTSLTADLEEATSSIKTFEADRDALTKERDNFKTQLETVEAENKGLIKQNVTLASYSRKVLAESVARLQVVLGKTEEDAFEATVSELTKETSRSLKEQLSELAKEKPQRTIQTVEHPTATAATDGEVAESTSQKTKELSLSEYAEKITAALNRQFN